MIYLAFGVGVFVGIVGTISVLMVISTKINKRRLVLYNKATTLWQKANELFETAKIWYAIGNKKDAAEALDEAARMAMDAQKLEDEADGKKAP